MKYVIIQKSKGPWKHKKGWSDDPYHQSIQEKRRGYSRQSLGEKVTKPLRQNIQELNAAVERNKKLDRLLAEQKMEKARARVHLETDPISLSIIAADGKEHETLDAANDKIIDIIVLKSKGPWKRGKKSWYEEMTHNIARIAAVHEGERAEEDKAKQKARKVRMEAQAEELRRLDLWKKP